MRDVQIEWTLWDTIDLPRGTRTLGEVKAWFEETFEYEVHNAPPVGRVRSRRCHE